MDLISDAKRKRFVVAAAVDHIHSAWGAVAAVDLSFGFSSTFAYILLCYLFLRIITLIPTKFSLITLLFKYYVEQTDIPKLSSIQNLLLRNSFDTSGKNYSLPLYQSLGDSTYLKVFLFFYKKVRNNCQNWIYSLSPLLYVLGTNK